MNYSIELMSKEYIGLAWNFCVSPNSCENPTHYELYLKLDALSDCRRGVGVTHVMLASDEDNRPIAIAGFITLRATSLISRDEDGNPVVHPALEIAELAVNKDYEHQGFGSTLVHYALCLADELRKAKLGIKSVVLCADKSAIGFYEDKLRGDLKFEKIGDLYEVPREGWNSDCEPMYIQLPELQIDSE